MLQAHRYRTGVSVRDSDARRLGADRHWMQLDVSGRQAAKNFFRLGFDLLFFSAADIWDDVT